MRSVRRYPEAMDTFIQIIPFLVAESLLVWSIWKLRGIAFVGSFVILLLACSFAVVSEGSSAVFGFIGICVILFGVTCIVLGDRVAAGAFISRSGLRAIGSLLFFLGFAGLFIL